MQFLQRSALLVGLLLSYQLIFSQTNSTNTKVETTFAVKIGKTKPVSELLKMPPLSEEKKAINKANKIIPNFIGRGYRPEKSPGALPNGPDKLWQKNLNKEGGMVIEPFVNVEGIAQGISGATPPDPTGVIGSKYYLQAVNATYLQVFDKEGNKMGNPFTANTIWSSIGFSSAGDPILLFDQEAERWIITEFPNGNQLLVAISEDDNPMGSYTAYNFSTPNFPDYPKFSIWPNALVVTTNEQGPGNLPAYFMEREALLNGEDVIPVQRLTLSGVGTGPGFQVATPVNWDGSTKPPQDANPMILTIQDDGWGVGQDQIVVNTIQVDFENSGNTVVTTEEIPTAPFDTYPCAAPGFGFACIPQLNGNGIDGLPEVIMFEVHYRNFNSYEAMVMNFITDANGDNLSGIRWIEMRRVGGGAWTVYQEGTFAPDDGVHRFMGSIAMDASGNIGLAYCASGEEIHPGLRFTGRRMGDPLGEMTVEEFVITEGFSVNNSSRYGDYAQMNVDPVNEKTFWFTGEYRAASGWSTKVVAFEFQRDTVDIGPEVVLSPKSSAYLTDMESVSVSVKNFGLDTQQIFKIGYQLDDNPAVMDDVDFILAPDSSYIHTFTDPVNLIMIGDYNFTFYTELEGDAAVFNDTLRSIVSKLTRFDAGISDITMENIICGDSTGYEIEISNYGQDTLTEATIEIYLNDNLVNSINWSGSLAFEESDIIGLNLTGFINGTNTILAQTILPNGMMDEMPENDFFSRNTEVILNAATVSFIINTDNFPNETTWELSDLNGNLLYSGGPYDNDNAQFEEILCLDKDACYSITIFDSYGDGICCSFGNGDYGFYDEEGLSLLFSNGDFGFSETNEFCATFECMMTAEVITTIASGEAESDGAIQINPQNGVDPLMFSIDGGITFQSSNLFIDLFPGTYAIVVTGDFGCYFEDTVTIGFCDLEFTVTTTDASNSNSMDGTVEIDAQSGNGPILYSIDGGLSFQSSNVFNNIDDGDYTIVVKDAQGCEDEMDVTINAVVGTKETVYGQMIKVYPNPNNGVFRIEIEGDLSASHFVEYEVRSTDGKLIQTGKLGKYDEHFTGLISLAAYANGSYYLRIVDENIDRMIHIIKQ
jgi:hypothetical protein